MYPDQPISTLFIFGYIGDDWVIREDIRIKTIDFETQKKHPAIWHKIISCWMYVNEQKFLNEEKES